jgi:hypothetical protein
MTEVNMMQLQVMMLIRKWRKNKKSFVADTGVLILKAGALNFPLLTLLFRFNPDSCLHKN